MSRSKKWQEKRLTLFALPWQEFIAAVGRTEKLLIKARVILNQEGRCNRCCLYEWQGQEVPLELEHIDGNHHNDEESNLEALCMNCHALTPTWRGRNKTGPKVTVPDDVLIAALKREPSIRQALISVGLAGKGGNYARAYQLRGT